ncbi:hypothetical protein HCB45_13165 [Listeria sp. FSL L7-0091]|uniref:hypothetical protein n=1 Tax=Listeria farberi TaxID=2713500 RepID=UPI001629922A|nr:hypothetical protein [Listeria farberi]MBC2262530.1 hypothetical protein [Listeria farberi]
MFFIGIDVGKRNNEVALIDKKGITVEKQFVLPIQKSFQMELKPVLILSVVAQIFISENKCSIFC